MTYQEFQTRYKYNTTSDRLGEGGFGKVFKAYDTYLDRWVAIKIAPVQANLESVRLKKEVELISKLPVHPNIARYEECFSFSSFDGEYDFGILQYYEAGNLLELIKKEKLSLQQKENILSQILAGVDFLHQNGIIHRDLKPQNILIVKRGNEYIPKITDFGISKKLDINKSSVFSNSIAGAGTLAYSSPEQLTDKTIRKNTDLWSFGVIAFQTLAGELPFNTGGHASTSEAGRVALFAQINSGKLPEKINEISQPWQDMIKACLVVDAEERVRNAEGCKELLYGKVEEIKTAFDIKPNDAIADTTEIGTPKVSNEQKQRTTEPIAYREMKKRNLKPLWIGLGSLSIILLLIWIISKPRPDNNMEEPLLTEIDTAMVAQSVDSISVSSANVVIPEPQTEIKLATLSTPRVSNITDNSANIEAKINVDGGGTITEKGICYSTSRNPTINSLTVKGKGNSDIITVTLPNLRENTPYYVRAYAKNEKGFAYSVEQQFRTEEREIEMLEEQLWEAEKGRIKAIAENLSTTKITFDLYSDVPKNL